MYSVDIFLSLKTGEYIAVSAFPITATQVTNQPRFKPYATGSSANVASERLAKSITGMTGTKNLGIINMRYYNRYLCVDCHNITSFETKAELIEHRQVRHNTASDAPYLYANVDKATILP